MDDSSTNTALHTAESIFTEAMTQYQPVKTFALFSGGYDSLSVTHWAMAHGADAVVHVNTGIGIPETRTFVRDTCRDYGWELLEYHPPVTYEELVLKYGFPGPAGHRYMYIYLKERCVRQLIRDYKTRRSDQIVLVTGVRKQESQRRMGNTAPIQKVGAQIWIAPFIEMSKIDVNRYVAEKELPRNPVVEHLHMSGECLCGAYAKPGELDEIGLFYPHVKARIESLEKQVAAAGFPWRWEEKGPPKWWRDARKGQMDMFNEFAPLCAGCKKAYEGEQA